MTNEIELVSDGDGLAVLGDPASVEAFLSTLGPSPSRELDVSRLSRAAGLGSLGLQANTARTASAPLPDAGRWVRITEESAQKIKDLGGLTPTKTPGVSHAMIGKPGASRSWIQLDRTPGQLPANPTMLAGAPALMAQLAMQQAMQEIAEYLAVIDAKVDDILRAQKDSVLAQVIGVGLQIDEAMTVRAHVGRVSDVTWSKVQAGSGSLADAQAYALLQLSGLADKVEQKSTIADLMKTAADMERRTYEWLAVLARCSQLIDGLAVLELDRVLESAPGDLDGHRLCLQAARRERLDVIEATTRRLVERIHTAAERANSRVLFNPRQSPAVVRSSGVVTNAVSDLHQRLGIGAAHVSTETRTWSTAAADVGRRAKAKGSGAIGAGRRLGTSTRSLASSASMSVSDRLRDRTRRRDPGAHDVKSEGPEDQERTT